MKNYIMKYFIPIIANLSIIVSCGSKTDTINKQEKIASESGYKVIYEGVQCNHQTREVKVITSKNELEKIYSEINQTRKPDLEVPKVDFTRNTLIIAYAGQHNHGGISVKVLDIKDTKDVRDFKFVLEKPEAGAMVTMAITTPFIIIKTINDRKKITASF